jgi:hypothetical protein
MVALNLTYQVHPCAYVTETPGHLQQHLGIRHEVVAYEWTWEAYEQMLFISVSNDEELETAPRLVMQLLPSTVTRKSNAPKIRNGRFVRTCYASQ